MLFAKKDCLIFKYLWVWMCVNSRDKLTRESGRRVMMMPVAGYES